MGEGHRPALTGFEVIVDAGCGDSTHHAHGAILIAVVNKRGRGRPTDRGHAVLRVIGVIRLAVVDLMRHAAISIVTEAPASAPIIVLLTLIPIT